MHEDASGRVRGETDRRTSKSKRERKRKEKKVQHAQIVLLCSVFHGASPLSLNIHARHAV
jgi:hypothetical protein